MQTFLPFADFQKSAAVLDNDRLGKQRVECLQILKALAKGKFTCVNCGATYNNPSDHCNNPCSLVKSKLTPWYNHPVTQMWKGYEYILYHKYMAAIVAEWLKRGYKDTCYDKARLVCNAQGSIVLWQSLDNPWWLGYEPLHASHRAVLLGKRPRHYKQFNWTEQPAKPINKKYPYIWPTQLPADVADSLKQRVLNLALLSASPVQNVT